MSRRTALLCAAAALGATALVPSGAQAALPCTTQGYLNPYALNLPGLATCVKDLAAANVTRVGTCTQQYDPLAPPFGTGAVGQTQAYADCLV